MMHRSCREPRPYATTMIGAAMIGTVTSQPERTGPDRFGKVAIRASSPLKPCYASAGGATAARCRARRRRLGAGGFLVARSNRASNPCGIIWEASVMNRDRDDRGTAPLQSGKLAVPHPVNDRGIP